jgi:hypothetical protein
MTQHFFHHFVSGQVVQSTENNLHGGVRPAKHQASFNGEIRKRIISKFCFEDVPNDLDDQGCFAYHQPSTMERTFFLIIVNFECEVAF